MLIQAFEVIMIDLKEVQGANAECVVSQFLAVRTALKS
jgi:hypothetical protein